MKKEILSRFYTKYKIIIYPVTVGFAGLTLLILVILPQIKAYFSNQESVGLIQKKIINLELKAEELEKISGEDLRRKVQSAVVAFPSEKDYTSAIGLLQRLSLEAGVILDSVTLAPGGDKSIPGISNFTVKIEVVTSTLSFDVFLEKIENAQAVLKIGGLSIEKSSDEQITASMDIDVYYSPPPKTLSSIDSPLQKLTEAEEVLAEKLVANLAAAAPATPNISEPSGGSEQPVQPVNLLPRGKVNPFE